MHLHKKGGREGVMMIIVVVIVDESYLRNVYTLDQYIQVYVKKVKCCSQITILSRTTDFGYCYCQ